MQWMPQTTPHTAILFFSRTAVAEAQHKVLTRVGDNLLLHKGLRKQAQRALEASGLPVFEFTEHNQRGHSFGERLAHAFETLYAQGYTQVISVGQDCPDLEAADIQAAVVALARGHEVVIGPDGRGGVYLLALTQAAYQREGFLQLAWQTKGLLDSLVAYTSSLSIAELKVKVDLNNAGDVKRHQHQSVRLAQLLRCLRLPRIGDKVINPQFRPSVGLPSVQGLRGPPVAI